MRCQLRLTTPRPIFLICPVRKERGRSVLSWKLRRSTSCEVQFLRQQPGKTELGLFHLDEREK
jgi:hypothetical protein